MSATSQKDIINPESVQKDAATQLPAQPKLTGEKEYINRKLRQLVDILIAAMVVLFIAAVAREVLLGPRSRYVEPLPTYDEVLSPKVSDYLTSHDQGIYTREQRDGYGNITHDKGDNQCDVLIYDHDDEYIYAYANCQEYTWFYHYNVPNESENVVKITRSVVRGTGWSSHVKLKYKPGTDFEIISYQVPRGGATYGPDLIKMFEPINRLGATDTNANREASERLLERFHQEHDSDPFPDHITQIYSHHNPKIIIGGEVES